MSVGFGLIKSMVENNLPLTELYEYGIDETYFIDQEKAAYNFLKRQKEKHGKYPQLQTIAIEAGAALAFDNLPSEPPEYFCTQVRQRKQYNIAVSTIQGLTKKADKQDISGCVQQIKDAYDSLLQTETGLTVKDIQDVQLEVLEDHDRRQIDPDLPGISYGFFALDEITGGQIGGDLNLIVGETGVCKSWVSFYMARKGHDLGARVLAVSPEMTERQAARRDLALQGYGRFQDRELKRGLVSRFGIEKAKEIIESTRGRDNYFKLMPSGLSSDVNQIISVASEYKPDLLLVDGIYLINDYKIRGQHWEAAESVYKKLKDFAISKNIAVLATTQYNTSNKKKLEGARSTQGARQIASNFYSLEFENEEDKETNSPKQYREFRVKKSRDGDRINFRIRLDFTKSIINQDQIISGPAYLDTSEDTSQTKEDTKHIEII